MTSFIKKGLIFLIFGTISAPLHAQDFSHCQKFLDLLLTDYQIKKRVVLERELTHFITNAKIENNPSPENVARGVRIIKWGSPQKEFRLDEAGAHFDESAFAFSLLPYFIDHPLSSWLIKTSDKGLKQSARFAREAKKIIPSVITKIKKKRVEDFGIKYFKYPKAHYDVFITVRISRELVTLAIPLFETKLDPFIDRDLLDKKILSVLASSMKYANSYLR